MVAHHVSHGCSRLCEAFHLPSVRHTVEAMNRPKSFSPGPTGRTFTAPRHDIRHASHLRGYDKSWERLRNWFISRNPLCAHCGRLGTEVDHIQPISVAPERRLSADNLQTLCHPCHMRKTARDARLQR